MPKPKKTTKGAEQDFEGMAHRVFDEFAKGATLNKRQLVGLLESMQSQQRIIFTSAAERETFAAEKFKEFDNIKKDGKLDFDEFYVFYKQFLTFNPDEVLKRAAETMSELEQLYVQFDADRNMNLTTAELVTMMAQRTPLGCPKPTNEQLAEIAKELMSMHDKDNSKGLSFQEFCEAFNDMIDALGKLHDDLKAQREAERKAAREKLPDPDEVEELKRWQKICGLPGRFEGEAWFVEMKELLGPIDDEDVALVQGRRISVLDKVALEDKTPILLTHPAHAHEFDPVTHHFGKRSPDQVIDVMQQCMDLGENKINKEQYCEQLRASLQEGWERGTPVIWRLGHAAPDFMLTFNMNGVLPLDLFEAPCMKPGQKLAKELWPMLRGSASTHPDKFTIADGFQFVITSCCSMSNWKRVLRGKLPLHFLRPVQVCHTTLEVCEVMRDGLQDDKDKDVQDALDLMDRWADML